jgi:hypothetical protein
MSERITFPTFDPEHQTIGAIGATEDSPGAFGQLMLAFGEPGDPPHLSERDLIRRVAPHTDFDKNVAHGTAILGNPVIQRRLGYDETVSPDRVAYDIVEHSELYAAVTRPLVRPLGPWEDEPTGYNYAVLLESKERRVRTAAQVLADIMGRGIQIERVIGVSSGRKVTDGESEDFMAGTASGVMMQGVFEEELEGVSVEMLHTDDTRGKIVAQVAADYIMCQGSPEDVSLLVPAAAGTWVEKGAILRRALVNAAGVSQSSNGGQFRFDQDPDYPQLIVAAGATLVDASSAPTSLDRQRAVPALGDVARSLMYMAELRDILLA